MLKLSVPETMRQPNSADELIDCALAMADIHSAAAVFELASGTRQQALQSILCSQRRHMLKLARWEHTPAAVLKMLADIDDKAVRLRIDKNPGTQADTLNNLYQAQRQDPQLQELLVQHQHCPASVLTNIAAATDSIDMLSLVAAHDHADADMLLSLEQRFPGQFDTELATHPATPAELLQRLFMRGNVYLRAAVLAHESCPEALLEIAAEETDGIVLRHLAANPRTQTTTLEMLADHAEVSVRRSVAANASTPKALLGKLIKDPADAVRRAVAAREDLSSAQRQQLITDPDNWVRQWLAHNPSIEVPELGQLAVDEESEVRRAVARNSKTPRQSVGNTGGRLKQLGKGCGCLSGEQQCRSTVDAGSRA
ncbi:hypothetical protein [Methylophaga lonarensis]|uniref:hypothetical protein n=1 Tax=Methylophaga lonarensis TaxID=999151 RepID=UPI000686FC52|nr:hypothetical protein [Methylophaga lonarensis]